MNYPSQADQISNSGNLTSAVAVGGLNVNSGWVLNPAAFYNPTYGSATLPGQLYQGVVGGFSFNPADSLAGDTMSMLSVELMRDRPAAPPALPDAIYPVDLDLSVHALRFHLMVYRDSDPDRASRFWTLVRLSQNVTHLDGRISFTSRRARRDFLTWWRRYTDCFFAGITPVDAYLPLLKPGRIKGMFVEHPTVLDNVPYQQSTKVYNADLPRGLIEALPAWAWIAGHCRAPVYRTQGGWIFASGAEAAKFILFDGYKKQEMI